MFKKVLIAKLSASGLGEIEVAEEAWTIRVRRPGDASGHSRRVTDKASRAQPGHAGHGHAPGSFEGHRAREPKPGGATIAASTNGAGPVKGLGEAATGGHRSDGGPDSHRVVATSPAVGVFQPRTDMKPGSRRRDGDRLGAGDRHGLPQAGVAPADEASARDRLLSISPRDFRPHRKCRRRAQVGRICLRRTRHGANLESAWRW